MRIEEISATLQRLKEEGSSLFVTSSFQTHSIPLLHIVAQADLDIPVYSLNTGFLFPETLAFRDEVARKLGVSIKDVFSDTPKHQQRDVRGNFFFTSNPDYCCHLNKVQPTARLLDKYDYWINGVRADQNANRKNMKVFQNSGQGATRFHPMLDWTSKEVFDYIRAHDLPRHPLDAQGYQSIGCEPCTRKANLDDPREARWFGINKTECGLHTDLVEKDKR